MQRIASTPIVPVPAEEALIQFLSKAPLGVVQAAQDGAIETINPMAADLLKPLSPAGRLDNLFAILGEVAPQLQRKVAAFPQASGIVCEAVRVPLIGRANSSAPQALFVSVLKLSADRLVATVSNAAYQPVAQEAGARRDGLAGELALALAEKQLFVLYQPVVGIRNRSTGPGGMDRTAGVEALVRWNHRLRGAVSPLDFIKIAEENALIGKLSIFVLSTACRQFVQWQSELGARAPRRLAVNLSLGQLAQPGFVALVGKILDASGMAPENLQLEVNESLVARDEAVQARLHDLRQLGLVLALDNFGTGQSSLAGLHRLPVDIVKIDRSFVAEAVDSEHHRVLIDATVRVAKSLEMTVAAEGIETEAQLAIVRQMGCENGQGYFFSEAISAGKVAEWLNTA